MKWRQYKTVGDDIVDKAGADRSGISEEVHLDGGGPPGELRLAQARGQPVGLTGNLFEYLAMFLKFRQH